MVQTIGQIYEQRILPKFTIPYFSDNFYAEETWLSSVAFPPLDHGLQKQYLPSLDNTIPPYTIQYYTHFLEYYLLAYARYFHRSIDKDYFSPVLRDPNYRDLEYFAQWFSYAYPSTKILVGLWTLCYLLPGWAKPKWYPPAGFCSGAISFLEVRF